MVGGARLRKGKPLGDWHMRKAALTVTERRKTTLACSLSTCKAETLTE